MTGPEGVEGTRVRVGVGRAGIERTFTFGVGERRTEEPVVGHLDVAARLNRVEFVLHPAVIVLVGAAVPTNPGAVVGRIPAQRGQTVGNRGRFVTPGDEGFRREIDGLLRDVGSNDSGPSAVFVGVESSGRTVSDDQNVRFTITFQLRSKRYRFVNSVEKFLVAQSINRFRGKLNCYRIGGQLFFSRLEDEGAGKICFSGFEFVKNELKIAPFKVTGSEGGAFL